MPLDIKICGLKTIDAVEAALDGGATHLGFIFFPKSPRHVEPAQAALLRDDVGGRAKIAAVTVDADDAALDEIVAAVRPDLLQLHGMETPERVAEVKARYGLPVMKAFSLREAADLHRVDAYRSVADHLLFDAKPPAGALLPGGNGVVFDWTILAGYGGPFFLSGGLQAGNVGEALRVTRPMGLDISSGVERAPGVKDISLIEQFFRAVRTAQAASLAA
ncbi:MAG TPA: phosphoribosylanthranilate isomerase [Mesorhizobium sp.]|jgi:phosphoribosylanthranilate isomerase|nr:phosphoribosylanthranilate isomerase [Mesorhizobium sp.]